MANVEKAEVDEVSGWMRVYGDGSVDRTWNGPPEAKCLVEQVPPHADFVDGVSTYDVTVNKQSGLRFRIYLPEVELKSQPNKLLPLIVHYHGGGFCVSDADWLMYYHFYTKLAKSLPAICVAPYFRLAPEHRLPAAFDDCFETLLWVRSLAVDQRLTNSNEQQPIDCLIEQADFERVFLVGDSAGANILHEVAARAGQADMSPLRLTGGILIHPGFVREERSKSELENPQTPFFNLVMLDKMLGYGLPLNSSKDHPYTCPMGPNAPPMKEVKIPPFLLCVAGNDLMNTTQMEYYEAMKKAGKDVELLTNEGVEHCFYLNKIAVDTDPIIGAQTSALLRGIADFIKKH